jgi:hypothetical protein
MKIEVLFSGVAVKGLLAGKMGRFTPMVFLEDDRLGVGLLDENGMRALYWVHPSENCVLTCWRAMTILGDVGSFSKGRLCLAYFAGMSSATNSAMAKEAKLHFTKRIGAAKLAAIHSSVPANLEAVLLRFHADRIYFSAGELIAAVDAKQLVATKELKNLLRSMSNEEAHLVNEKATEKKGRLLTKKEFTEAKEVLKVSPLGRLAVDLIADELTHDIGIASQDGTLSSVHILGAFDTKGLPTGSYLLISLLGGLKKNIRPQGLICALQPIELQVDVIALNFADEAVLWWRKAYAKSNHTLSPKSLPGKTLASARVLTHHGQLLGVVDNQGNSVNTAISNWLRETLSKFGCALKTQ